jgi:hypothetical protein
MSGPSALEDEGTMFKTQRNASPVTQCHIPEDLNPSAQNPITVNTRVCCDELVEALHYKPEGSGFDSQWFYWNFLLT